VTAPRTVHLMRHGEPEGAGRMIGHRDPPATAAGIAACVAAAASLSPVAAIVTSDLGRARGCADAIGHARGLAIAHDARWRELDFGDWDGRHPGDLDADALARFWDDPDAAPPPGGERWSALVARIGAAIPALADGTLVVTHAGAIRAALAVLCGFDTRQIWTFALPYAGVVTLRLWPGSPPTVQIARLA
jgi:alpha-ribazole phosphatase